MKISACMIVKNEEKNIEKCINSYKEIVDEIIVVDTGSEDNTVEIAKDLGASVYFFKWINDFAAAKNYALDKAKGDWIIFLDADEYFGQNSAKKVRGILKSLQGTNYSAVGCKLININKVNNKTIDSFMQVRIFRNDKNIRYKSSIHESLSKKNDKVHIMSFYDEIEVYHTGYSTDINKGKAKRNLEILLEDIKSNGENKEYYRYLCDCYFALEDYENALKYGELHLSSNVKVIGYESRIHKVILDCMWNLGRPRKEIEQRIKNTIEIFPDHPNFYCSYGFFLLDEKRYEESLNNLLRALSYNNSYNGIEVNLILGVIPYIHYRIGFIYEVKNCYEKAVEHYYLSLSKDRFNKDAFQAIFKIIRNEKLEDTIAFLNSIYDINNENDVRFIVDELIKLKPRGILAYYANIWYKNFGHEDSALTFTLLAEGKFETAYKIFSKGYGEESNEILAIVSGILSGDSAIMKELLNTNKPSFKRIIRAYEGKSNMLLEEDLDNYVALFRELCLFDRSDVIKRFLDLRSSFKSNVSIEIAKVLMSNENYKDALKFYNESVQEVEDKNILMYIGYCNYKRGEHNIAYINIKKAIQNGYSGNDAHEFLRWIGEKM